MKLAALYSGGKDSTYSMHLALEAGHEIFSLVTLRPENDSSYMFHYPNLHLSDMLAEALDLPLVVGETTGEKEKELEDLKQVLEEIKVAGAEGVCTGAVASSYQYERIARLSKQVGLKGFHPLWQRNDMEVVLEMLSAGFEIFIVGVAAKGLSQDWLGRKLDAEALEELAGLKKKYGLSVVGEGGEFETLAVDGPLFKKRLVIEQAETEWKGSSGRWVVKKAHLEKKGE